MDKFSRNTRTIVAGEIELVIEDILYTSGWHRHYRIRNTAYYPTRTISFTDQQFDDLQKAIEEINTINGGTND